MHPLKWQIDPAKTAMENLWDAVHVAVYFLCAEYGRKVKMTEEEWSDFKQTVIYNSVCAFLNNKIGPRNSYSHQHSFYQNVYSVVWSRFYRDLVAFQNKWIKPKMTSIDRLETNGTVSPDFRETLLKPIPRYLRDGERVLCRQDLKSWKSQTTNYFAVKHRQEELEYDIEEDRLELFGENYKPTDWAALRERRRKERMGEPIDDSPSKSKVV